MGLPSIRDYRNNRVLASLRLVRMTIPTQTWDPEGYARNARFVAELGQGVVDLLAPQPGERILDLGCGDGYLTAKLAALGCDVLGVDSSAAQVEAARGRGIKANVRDALDLDYETEFDAVFSNATLHWIKDADRAITNVFRALKPGGRFVGEFGGAGGLAHIRTALEAALARRGIEFAALDPWYFPTADEYRARLERQGFVVQTIALFPRPTPLPGEMTAWLETFARSFTSALEPVDRPAFLAEVQEALRPHLFADGKWTADYVRLRFSARKPAEAHSVP
jgi:SAM-dependent methyltransferase